MVGVNMFCNGRIRFIRVVKFKESPSDPSTDSFVE